MLTSINKKDEFVFHAAMGVILISAILPIVFLPNTSLYYLPITIFCFFLAGFAYIFSVIFLKRKFPTQALIWVIAILARLLIFSSAPSLSTDIYRYVWDGNLVARGINPYDEPVNSTVLDPYNIPGRELVNHPEMASPYLPAAQVYFGLVGSIFPQQVKAYQAVSVLIDLINGYLILLILNKYRIRKSAVLIYLWNPLVIIEFSHSAHVDGLMVMLILLAWYFAGLNQKYGLLSALAMAFATLVKGIPLLIAPLFLKSWRKTGLILYFIIIASSILISSWNSGLGMMGELDGKGVFGAIRIYSQFWVFNPNPLYKLLTTSPSLGYEFGGVISRVIAGLIILSATVYAYLQSTKKTDPAPNSEFDLISNLRYSLLPFGAYVLFWPTVHPWYLTWIIPLLPFFYVENDKDPYQYIRALPWIFFSIIIFLSYFAYLPDSESLVPDWVTWIEYLPMYFFLIVIEILYHKKLHNDLIQPN